MNKKENSNQISRKVEAQHPKATTPSKQSKKIVTIKYGLEKEREKLKD